MIYNTHSLPKRFKEI